jgi:hypothetical protein
MREHEKYAVVLRVVRNVASAPASREAPAFSPGAGLLLGG